MDVLAYWRDYQQNRPAGLDTGNYLHWHSNARLFEDVKAGDRLWLVTAGRNLNGHAKKAPQAGFLVAVWRVRQVITNPGDDAVYPISDYRYRVIADATASLLLDEPVLVDHILRPSGRDRARSIGSFLQGPRKIDIGKVRMLRAAAGPQMARQYLSGRQL